MFDLLDELEHLTARIRANTQVGLPVKNLVLAAENVIQEMKDLIS